MTNNNKRKRTLRGLLRDERGAILLITTCYLPVIIGFFTLAVDMAYVYRTRAMLQATADSAALAATMNGLPDATASCAQAKTYASKNMDPTVFGNVLKQNSADCSDVQIGMWNCIDGQVCSAGSFVADAVSACGYSCNAVKVTTRMAASNGNALTLAFASMVGWSKIDVPATAIATFGGTGVPWNVTLVQDISPSFREELASPNKQAQTADQALLDCMKLNASKGSTLGIEVFATSNLLYQSPLAVNDTTTTTTGHGHNTTTTTTNNNDTLSNKISSIAVCGSGNPMPDCGTGGSGSSGVTNIGGAISAASGVLCSGGSCPSASTSTEAIILITDGQANSCGSSACPSGQNPLTYAEAQAKAAGDKGIDVYTICYGCSSSDATWLAKLVKGKGFAMKAPTIDDIKKSMQQACASGLQHRLVW